MNNFWLTFIIAMYSILVFVYPIFRAAGDCVIRDLVNAPLAVSALQTAFLAVSHGQASYRHEEIVLEILAEVYLVFQPFLRSILLANLTTRAG